MIHVFFPSCSVILQVVPQSQHHHRAYSSIQHEIHAVQSKGLLFTGSLQAGEGDTFTRGFTVNPTVRITRSCEEKMKVFFQVDGLDTVIIFAISI